MNEISINIIDLDGQNHVVYASADSELNLMEVVKAAGFSMGNCGGMALCASCHCYVEHRLQLNNQSEAEKDMLHQLHNSDFTKSRLICQIPITKELNGVTLKIV